MTPGDRVRILRAGAIVWGTLDYLDPNGKLATVWVYTGQARTLRPYRTNELMLAATWVERRKHERRRTDRAIRDERRRGTQDERRVRRGRNDR